MTLRLEDLTDPALTDFDTFIFSRWNVGITDAPAAKLHPKRPARIQAVGYTQSIGKPLYAHWMRNGKRVHTRRLGVIAGPVRRPPRHAWRAASRSARCTPGTLRGPLQPVAHEHHEVRDPPPRRARPAPHR